jgi:hypothetical protein
MARELMEREVIDADQLQRILDEHVTPQIAPGTEAAVRVAEPPSAPGAAPAASRLQAGES